MTESSSEFVQSKSEATPEDIWALALEEFHTRLTENPSDVPTYALGQMLTTVARVMDKQVEPPEIQELDPLGSLENLPLERQRELLEAELERLDAQRSKYLDLLDELENQDGEAHA